MILWSCSPPCSWTEPSRYLPPVGSHVSYHHLIRIDGIVPLSCIVHSAVNETDELSRGLVGIGTWSHLAFPVACHCIASLALSRTTGVRNRILLTHYALQVINGLNGGLSTYELGNVVAVLVMYVNIDCSCRCEERSLKQLGVSALRLSLVSAHHFHLTSTPRAWKTLLRPHRALYASLTFE